MEISESHCWHRCENEVGERDDGVLQTQVSKSESFDEKVLVRVVLLEESLARNECVVAEDVPEHSDEVTAE